MKKGAFSHFERRSEGWESYESREQRSRLPVLFGQAIEAENCSCYFGRVSRLVARWGVRKSVPGELVPPPMLAGTLPVEAATAENLLSNHMGENTQRLTAEWTQGRVSSPRRHWVFPVSTNSTSTTVPKCEASTLAFISLPFVASSDSFTASLWDHSFGDQPLLVSSLRAKLPVGNIYHTFEDSYVTFREAF